MSNRFWLGEPHLGNAYEETCKFEEELWTLCPKIRLWTLGFLDSFLLHLGWRRHRQWLSHTDTFKLVIRVIIAVRQLLNFVALCNLGLHILLSKSDSDAFGHADRFKLLVFIHTFISFTFTTEGIWLLDLIVFLLGSWSRIAFFISCTWNHVWNRLGGSLRVTYIFNFDSVDFRSHLLVWLLPWKLLLMDLSG